MHTFTSSALVSAALLFASVASADDEAAPEAGAPPAAGVAPAPTSPTATLPASAALPSRRPFGSAGTVILDDTVAFGTFVGGATIGAQGVGVGSTGWLRFVDAKADYGNGQTNRMTLVGIAPSLDVFVASQFSVGGEVSVFTAYGRAGNETSNTGGGIRPRLGWVFALSDDLALWTRVFGSVSAGHSVLRGESVGPGVPDVKSTTLGWGLGADVALVAPIGRSVALTFGPTVNYGKVDIIDSTPASPSAYTSGASSAMTFGGRVGIAIVL